MSVALTRRRFTVDDYYKMATAGIFTEDDRVELIDGEIVEMPPIGDRHAGGVDRIASYFWGRYSDVAQVRVQNPVRLNDYSEPEPDLALLRPRADFYASGHPTPADVLLLVEVADTSVDADRQVKVPLYARNGIPETWLLDLPHATLTVYRDPAPDGYRSAQVLRAGEEVAPLAVADRPLSVAAILGLG